MICMIDFIELIIINVQLEYVSIEINPRKMLLRALYYHQHFHNYQKLHVLEGKNLRTKSYKKWV